MVTNHWIAVLLSFYCYKNHLSDSIKCIQSVLTEVISKNITISIKSYPSLCIERLRMEFETLLE